MRPAPVRRMRINKSDLVQHGFNKDCAQCEHIQKYGNARPGHTHTDACRRQLEEAMGATEEGRERLAAHDESLTRSMAEQVERSAERTEQVQQRSETKRGFLDRGTVETTLPQPVGPEGTPIGAAQRPSEPHPRDASIPYAEQPATTGIPIGTAPRSMPIGTAPDSSNRAPSVPDAFDRGNG